MGRGRDSARHRENRPWSTRPAADVRLGADPDEVGGSRSGPGPGAASFTYLLRLANCLTHGSQVEKEPAEAACTRPPTPVSPPSTPPTPRPSRCSARQHATRSGCDPYRPGSAWCVALHTAQTDAPTKVD